MIQIQIPGRKKLEIKQVVLDFNGTMAIDGKLDMSVVQLIEKLSRQVDMYILSSDTYNTVLKQCQDLPIKIFVVANADDKKRFIEELGKDNTASIGNGVNDQKMFQVSALSIAVMGKEGCSVKAILDAHILVHNVTDALGLLLYPNRIVATLRE